MLANHIFSEWLWKVVKIIVFLIFRMPSILRSSNRYRRDQRQLEEEEDMWFNEEDDFTDVPSTKIAIDIDSSLGKFFQGFLKYLGNANLIKNLNSPGKIVDKKASDSQAANGPKLGNTTTITQIQNSSSPPHQTQTSPLQQSQPLNNVNSINNSSSLSNNSNKSNSSVCETVTSESQSQSATQTSTSELELNKSTSDQEDGVENKTGDLSEEASHRPSSTDSIENMDTNQDESESGSSSSSSEEQQSSAAPSTDNLSETTKLCETENLTESSEESESNCSSSSSSTSEITSTGSAMDAERNLTENLEREKDTVLTNVLKKVILEIFLTLTRILFFNSRWGFLKVKISPYQRPSHL